MDYVNAYDNGNDIWGYVAPDGSEYAIVGTEIGTLIYSLEDPTNPIERAFIPGVFSIWRDMRHWGEYVYVTADAGSEGLLVIDMRNAPENIEYIYRIPEVISTTGDSIDIKDCHNIHIDEFGYIYLAGCEGRGTEILDSNANPWNPPIVGAIESPYHHDNFVQDNILYGSEIFTGNLAMYDVSDKENPVLIGSAPTAGNFTHNAWADPENLNVFTTDEIPNGKITALDITDPSNIERLDVFEANNTQNLGTIPHNTHFINDYLVTSWYTEGVVVIDASQPENLVQVAQYDTYAGNSGGSAGCWGVTPFLPSGIVLANDRNSGLYVLEVDYKRAARLEGMVVNASNGDPIGNVEVSFIDGDDTNFKKSDPTGSFKSGQVSEGNFLMQFHHPYYNNKIVEVNLEQGTTTELFVEMTQDFSNQNFKVVDRETGLAIENASIEVSKKGNIYELTTDNLGLASKSMLSDVYTIHVGKWGYLNEEFNNIVLDDEGQLVLKLQPRYADDFVLDLGWETSFETTADEFKGNWEREEPFGTGGTNKFNPAADVLGDIGTKAYITGNSEWASFGTNIVKQGSATLVSPPMDLSTYENPSISLQLWMVRTIKELESNVIEIYFRQNGEDKLVYIHENTENESTWIPIEIPVEDFIFKNLEFQVVIKVEDDETYDSLIEAGVDQFRIQGNRIERELAPQTNLTLYTNPATDELSIYNETQNISTIEILDITGRHILSRKPGLSFVSTIPLDGFISGNYVVKVVFEDGTRWHQKFQVVR